MSVHWVFDDIDRLLTMTSCPHTVVNARSELESGRFPIGNIFHYWKNNWWNRDGHEWRHSGIADRPDRYAYNIGTWNDHGYWTGCDGNQYGFGNFLDYVHPAVLDDARAGKAKLVIDNLNEGFYDDTFYAFMHDSMRRYGLPGSAIIWMSGNELDDRGYNAWCDDNGIMDRFSIVSFCHLLYMQQINLRYRPRPTWADHEAAKANPRLVKIFNCLNRRSRDHRELLMMLMVDAGLHSKAAISHDILRYHAWADHGVPQDLIDRTSSLLPLVIDDGDFDNNKAMHINTKIYMDSWVSCVTETHAIDQEHNLFISEKIWKPIFALQPFLVMGHMGSLELLRSWGFQTFPMLFDECYDDMPFFDRARIIVNNLQRLEVIPDKRGWLAQAREACEWNQERFLSMDWFNDDAYRRFMRAYHRES